MEDFTSRLEDCQISEKALQKIKKKKKALRQKDKKEHGEMSNPAM